MLFLWSILGLFKSFFVQEQVGMVCCAVLLYGYCYACIQRYASDRHLINRVYTVHYAQTDHCGVN